MTRKQKNRRSDLERRYGRPDPRAIEKSVTAALELVVPRGSAVIELHSDDHRAYPRAIRALPGRRFLHEVTSSKARRTTSNPLFPANLLHLLYRHGGSNHKRETIAFSKRNQSMIWREAVTRVWRNYVKHVSERRKRDTPAMRLGLTRRPLGWDEILAKRIFVTTAALSPTLEPYYFGRVPTRQMPGAREHRLRFAV